MFQLLNHGILGINARNLLYIRAFNKEKSVLMADDKLKTKAFLSARNILVPKLYGVIDSMDALTKLDLNKLPHSFVIKPNLGYGGEGIIPIIQHHDDKYISIDGQKYNKRQLMVHIHDILDGRFSITNLNDKAFFEQLISPDEILGKFSYKGLPDIRVIVHNLIPVMAMLRIPTRESKGKANLHQGAIGAGIDIARGEITHLIHHNRIIREITEIGEIRGLKIPYWDQVLSIAVQAQIATNLGYLAADIAIDKGHGPILLEINARAGLSVQIANLAPLRKRLERIRGLKIRTPEKGIRIAKEMFGSAPEKREVRTSDKKIVSIEENVGIIFKDQTKKVMAFLDTGIERSIIDETFASENHLLENHDDYDDEKSTLKLKISVAGKRLQSIFDVEKIHTKNYKVILGQRDLMDNFLIDPSRKKMPARENGNDIKKIETIKSDIDFHDIDETLAKMDKKIKLLYYLRPVNLDEERKKFFADFSYNPQFRYPEIKYDAAEMKKELSKIIVDDSPLGILFYRKNKEIEKKIELQRHRGTQSFTLASVELFGKPADELMKEAENILAKNKTGVAETEDESVTAESALETFSNVLKDYALHDWKVHIKEDLVTNCVAGKNNTLLIRKHAKFSPQRLKSLIIHEIETHILTAENGKQQPYLLFNCGFADYLVTQEGLALYNVKRQGLETNFDRIYKAALVKATAWAFQMSFAEVFIKLLEIGLSQEKAFRVTLKLKRGLTDTSKKGSFTKDYLYFLGEREVERFVKEGGKLQDLYIGKFNIRDLPMIHKIEGLKPPKFLPKWLAAT